MRPPVPNQSIRLPSCDDLGISIGEHLGHHPAIHDNVRLEDCMVHAREQLVLQMEVMVGYGVLVDHFALSISERLLQLRKFIWKEKGGK